MNPYPYKKKLIYILIISFVLVIIGLSINLSGCSDKYGGGCNFYKIKKASVLFSGCTKYLGTGEYDNRQNKIDDDNMGTIRSDCYAKVKYDDVKCKIHRSDQEKCVNVKDKHTRDKCLRYIVNSYPVNSTITVYVKDDVCYSHHYVERKALIGFVFIIIGGIIFMFIIIMLNFVKEENKLDEDYIIPSAPPEEDYIIPSAPPEELEMNANVDVSLPIHAIDVEVIV
jgi:hypothetical protein